jgi:hypothetical protein
VEGQSDAHEGNALSRRAHDVTAELLDRKRRRTSHRGEGGGTDADVYCADLTAALAGSSLNAIRTAVATNSAIQDYYPVLDPSSLYFVRWRSATNHADFIQRKQLANLSQPPVTASFCTSADTNYSDPCIVGAGRVIFSATGTGAGGYDLFTADFGDTAMVSLDALLPALNSAKHELGCAFWHP